MLSDAVVNAFVVSAKDDEIFFERQIVGHMLRKLLTIRTGEDNLVIVALSFQR